MEDERKERQFKLQNTWKVKNTKRVDLCFNITSNELDKMIYEYLESQNSKGSAIKELLSEAIEARNKRIYQEINIIILTTFLYLKFVSYL